MTHVDEEWQVTPDGLWRWAKDFQVTARKNWGWVNKDCAGADQYFHPGYFPTQYLTCHALELGLKAFLRAKGESVKNLRRGMGHDLVKLFNRAFELGLGDVFVASRDFQEMVELISPQYLDQDFKYFQSKATYDNDVDSLLENIKRLVDAIHPVCVGDE